MKVLSNLSTYLKTLRHSNRVLFFCIHIRVLLNQFKIINKMIITICKNINKSFLLIVQPPVRQTLFPPNCIIRKKLD